jgi:hypothetical protein
MAEDWKNKMGNDGRGAYDEAMRQAQLFQNDLMRPPDPIELALGLGTKARVTLSGTRPLAGFVPSEKTTSQSETELEKAVRSELGKAQPNYDLPWYLPRSLVGDKAYLNQGLLLHGGLAALALRYRQALPAWGNAGYVGFSVGTGRTQDPKIGEGGVPVLPDAPY